MTQPGLNATVTGGTKKVIRYIESERQRADKAMETAVRVTAFQMRRKLQQEIRSGAPGGQRLSPLSYIARRLHGNAPNRKPLRALASQVRYDVVDKRPFTMTVGFVSPSKGSYTLSKSWQRIAKQQQEGFERPIPAKLRGWIIEKGGVLGKADNESTPFFLKKSTRTFKTPPRPIVAPFWSRHKNQARQDIRSNFRRKMAGERI